MSLQVGLRVSYTRMHRCGLTVAHYVAYRGYKCSKPTRHSIILDRGPWTFLTRTFRWQYAVVQIPIQSSCNGETLAVASVDFPTPTLFWATNLRCPWLYCPLERRFHRGCTSVSGSYTKTIKQRSSASCISSVRLENPEPHLKQGSYNKPNTISPKTETPRPNPYPKSPSPFTKS